MLCFHATTAEPYRMYGGRAEDEDEDASWDDGDDENWESIEVHLSNLNYHQRFCTPMPIPISSVLF